MNTPFLIIFLIIFPQLSSAANLHEKSTDPALLNCSSGRSEIAISDAGAPTIAVFFDWNQEDVYDFEKSTDGDCAGRGLFDCYQYDQMMINIPKSLSLGKKTEGRVWVNLDTDDDNSAGRLGESYNCRLTSEE